MCFFCELVVCVFVCARIICLCKFSASGIYCRSNVSFLQAPAQAPELGLGCNHLETRIGNAQPQPQAQVQVLAAELTQLWPNMLDVLSQEQKGLGLDTQHMV